MTRLSATPSPCGRVELQTPDRSVDVEALEEALSRLETLDPTQGRVVELRYFGGLRFPGRRWDEERRSQCARGAARLTGLRRTGDHRPQVRRDPTWGVFMVRETRSGRTVAALLVLMWVASTSIAAPIPSKAPGSVSSLGNANPTSIEASLARQEVADALAAHGLSAEEVELRVAQLSAEDLSVLAANLDQIRAAGAVPNYIWVLLAILIGVTIVATVF